MKPKQLKRIFTRFQEQHDLIAEQNYQCCQNCALAELNNRIDAGECAAGYVYYHNQDHLSYRSDKRLSLRYGDLKGTKKGSTKIGELIAKVFEECGWIVEWGGDSEKSIVVRKGD